MIPSDNQKQSVGLRIKEARSALGLTQKELCDKTGMPLQSLRGYELSHRTPGGDAIEYLVRIGINANWLLTGEGEMLLADYHARLEAERKESFGDAPAQYAQNPNAAFEVLLKRLGEATQATVRISKQYDHPLPTEWTSLIQELMSMHGLSEAGARRVIDELLKAQARK